jgi:hypothetical protein
MRAMETTRTLRWAAAAALAPLLSAQTFEAPVRILADGKPIDVEIGHAAPCVRDFDGDGVRDLLVGQFGHGKLRIYRNQGTDKAPVYGAFTFLQAGGEDATVPAG